MVIQDQDAPIRILDSADDLAESRLEAVGYIFHGSVPAADGKRPRGGANLLHFARCAKLDRVPVVESKMWFRTIQVAKAHLDGLVGTGRWKWCKLCEKEITQRLINE
jgi:hypothetical protein